MRQLVLDFPAVERYGRDHFTCSPSNQAAFDWVERWPDWPAYGLIITGPAASGKTHLAHLWKEKTGAIALSPEALVVNLEEGLVDRPILLEHAEQVADEIAFFHLLNSVREARQSVLLTSQAAVGAWPQRLPDLTSRLKALPAVAVDAPDDALLGAFLYKYFADRQLTLKEDVVAYLMPRMERSMAAARRLAAALHAASLEEKRPLTVPLAREVLTDTNSQSIY